MLVRQAPRVSSGCACLMLHLICSGEKPKSGSYGLIRFLRCSEKMCQSQVALNALVLGDGLVASDWLVILTGLHVFQRH